MPARPAGLRLLRTGLLIALTAAGLGGCRAAPAARPPLILIVSLDTFRADLLEESGPDGAPLTPRLLELGAQATRFDSAWAPVAFTLPSHMTLLTGLHPEVHGVDEEGESLAPGTATLAGLLAASGYRTAAVVNSTWMRGEFGFDRGFERYERLQGLAGSASRVTDRALAALEHAGDRRPLLLFVHYFEAHSDFPSQGTRLSYWSPPSLRTDLPVADEATCDEAGRCATEALAAADAEGRELPAATVELHHELYRRGAAFLDAELGRLFDGVRAAARWDDALVVVTSDHGEEFREHGRFLHTQAHRESLHVPLLVKRPGGLGAGARDPRLVELADLLPTVAARVGVPAPPGASGIDLFGAGGSERDALVGRDRNGERVFALRTAERLLLRDLDSGRSRLFLLDRDPGEAADRAPELAEEARRLATRLDRELRRLRALRTAPPGADGARFEDAERERLRALGYL